MATKTFEELKQLAIQIRDEKTNKQNTATRIGTQMLEHLNKLEQDYYDKTATDEELKQRDEKLTELSSNFDYALLIGTIELNTYTKTFTIKKGTNVIGCNRINKVLDSDLSVTKDDTDWNSHFILLDIENNTLRLIQSNKIIEKDYASELIIALVRWTECIYQGNFSTYILNGEETINFKLNRSNTFPYYALLYNTIPKLDTSAKTFTLPSNSHILGNNGSVLLPNDLIYTQEDIGTDSGSHILILDVKTLKKRGIASGKQVYLKDNEVALAYVRWEERVYQANFPKYYLNDTLVTLCPDRDYGGEIDTLTTKSGEDLASNSYYNLQFYKVGDTVSNLSPTPISTTFYNYHPLAELNRQNIYV